MVSVEAVLGVSTAAVVGIQIGTGLFSDVLLRRAQRNLRARLAVGLLVTVSTLSAFRVYVRAMQMTYAIAGATVSTLDGVVALTVVLVQVLLTAAFVRLHRAAGQARRVVKAAAVMCCIVSNLLVSFQYLWMKNMQLKLNI
jgi:hypothetical protein